MLGCGTRGPRGPPGRGPATMPGELTENLVRLTHRGLGLLTLGPLAWQSQERWERGSSELLSSLVFTKCTAFTGTIHHIPSPACWPGFCYQQPWFKKRKIQLSIYTGRLEGLVFFVLFCFFDCSSCPHPHPNVSFTPMSPHRLSISLLSWQPHLADSVLISYPCHPFISPEELDHNYEKEDSLHYVLYIGLPSLTTQFFHVCFWAELTVSIVKYDKWPSALNLGLTFKSRSYGS